MEYAQEFVTNAQELVHRPPISGLKTNISGFHALARYLLIMGVRGIMSEDRRSDEQLITAFRAGEPGALDTLIARYLERVWYYLAKHSWFRDESYLDDLRQQVFLTIFQEIKNGRFLPAGEGSSKGWLYKVAYLECLRADKKRRKEFKSLSEYYPKEPTGLPDDLLAKQPPAGADYERTNARLADALARLTPEEQKLIHLLAAGKSYREIRADPDFSKYSLAYLKLKIYNTRCKAKKLAKE